MALTENQRQARYKRIKSMIQAGVPSGSIQEILSGEWGISERQIRNYISEIRDETAGREPDQDDIDRLIEIGYKWLEAYNDGNELMATKYRKEVEPIFVKYPQWEYERPQEIRSHKHLYLDWQVFVSWLAKKDFQDMADEWYKALQAGDRQQVRKGAFKIGKLLEAKTGDCKPCRFFSTGDGRADQHLIQLVFRMKYKTEGTGYLSEDEVLNQIIDYHQKGTNTTFLYMTGI